MHLKNGMTMYCDGTNTITLSNAGASSKIIGTIYIDIDGKKGDSVPGKDVFMFYLDKSGALIPVGSKANNYVLSVNSASANSTYFNVNNDCAPSSSDIKKGFACTGVIADNGWSTKGLDEY